MLGLFLLFISLFFPMQSFAHENYVLSKQEITKDMLVSNINVLSSLGNPDNLKIAIFVAIGSLIAIIIYFLFQHSRPGSAFDRFLKKFEPLGHVILRVALGVSFLASAYTNSYLGPEIPSSSIPFGQIIHYVLYIIGTLLIVGAFTEIVGVIALVIIFLATLVYGGYMLTYFNYFGEFVALIIFGSYVFSLDSLFFKPLQIAKKLKKYEIPIIRIAYGISVLYPAISIKLLHPEVIIDIANRYHLGQVHWLFPSSPLLIALGTGLAQIAVGLFIVVGFETRLNSFVTFILYILSILYFKEAVWPHYILLALALYLVINNGGQAGVDSLIEKYFKKKA